MDDNPASPLDPRLAFIAHAEGFVPVEHLTPRIYVDAARGFDDWRQAFSAPLVRRLEAFRKPDVFIVEPDDRGQLETSFTRREIAALRKHGAFFAFTRIVSERRSTQGRPELDETEVRLRESLALEVFRRIVEIDFLLTISKGTRFGDYLEAVGLMIDCLPILTALAKAKNNSRSAEPNDRADDETCVLADEEQVRTFLHRLTAEGERLPYRVDGEPALSGAALRSHAVERLRTQLATLLHETGAVTVAIERRLRLIQALAKGYLRAALVTKTERALGRRERARAVTLAKHPDPAGVLLEGKGRIGKKTAEAAFRSRDRGDMRVLVDPQQLPEANLGFGEMTAVALFADVDPFRCSFRFVLWWKELSAAREFGRMLRGEDSRLADGQAGLLFRQQLPQECRECPIEEGVLVEFHRSLSEASFLLPYGG